MNRGGRISSQKLQKMRQSCREARNRIASMIHNRFNIGLRPPNALFPCRNRFMQIEDRLVAFKAELIEQGNRQSKQSLHRFLMISLHCHGIVRVIK